MRELTKSTLRFWWALPLFGLEQMVRLSVPSDAHQRQATWAFDAVSDAAKHELGDFFTSTFDTGDRMQRAMTNALFRVPFLDLFDPARWLPKDRTSKEGPSGRRARSGRRVVDTDLDDEQVKLVAYDLVSLEPRAESVLDADSLIVKERMTADSFATRVIDRWRRESPKQAQGIVDENLRVLYEVQERWPRQAEESDRD